MTAITLMERLETLGIRLEAIDSRLRFFPAELVSDDMRREMAVHKSEILRLLQKPQVQALDRNEIIRRVGAMRLQLPKHLPYPFFVARKEIEWKRGNCHSCGEALNAEENYLCSYCVSAKYLLLGLTEDGKT